MNLNHQLIFANRVQGMNALVSLIGGGQMDTKDVRFMQSTHRFFTADGEDITNKLYRADKKANWSGFDETFDNERLSVERYMREHNGQLPPNIGSSSVFWNLGKQLVTDPLGAPLDAADTFVENTLKSVVSSSAVWVVGGLVLAYLLASKHLK
jgi:hypothetical protein